MLPETWAAALFLAIRTSISTSTELTFTLPSVTKERMPVIEVILCNICLWNNGRYDEYLAFARQMSLYSVSKTEYRSNLCPAESLMSRFINHTVSGHVHQTAAACAGRLKNSKTLS